MEEKPQPAHQVLERLVGNWTAEMECVMGPDAPPTKSKGEAVGRSLGGFWYVIEGTSDGPNGSTMTSIISLGYDPASQRYVGTFIADCMSKMWLYNGQFDVTGRKLVLDTEGPKFDGSGTTKYQDIYEIVGDDHWILSSQIQGDDGNWIPFMNVHYRRK